MEDCLKDIIARFWFELYRDKDDPLHIFFILTQFPYWVYMDYGRKKYNAIGVKEKEFCLEIIKRCDFLERYLENFDTNYREFYDYRSKIPTYGAVLLNKSLDKVVLVENHEQSKEQSNNGLNNHNYNFPKGKIEKWEKEIECGIREVKEETGFDISDLINEKEYIFCEGIKRKYIKLFVVTGIDEKACFKPTVKNEIDDVRY